MRTSAGFQTHAHAYHSRGRLRFRRATVRFIAVLLCVCVTPTRSDDLLAGFRDPDDGEIDLSQWLLDRRGFCRSRS
jgi:hypothetical protein